MAENVGLDELVGSVAGSIVSAQAQVENHFIEQVSRYFDDAGRPRCLKLRLPNNGSASDEEDNFSQLGIPLLSLTESTMLAIRDMTIELDVELGSVVEGHLPGAAPLAEPALREPVDDHGFTSAGAPIDVPEEGAPSREVEPEPAPAAGAPPAVRAPAKRLALAVGKRPDSGPLAKLTINVTAQDKSEGLLRLLTQLNKYV